MNASESPPITRVSQSLAWRFSLLLTALLAILTALAMSGCTLPSGGQDGEISISGVPVVQIAAPLPNASYLEGVAVNIQASVLNAGADINRVEIAVDNVTIAALQAPNPSGAAIFSITQTWPAGAVGQHTIAVTAFRADGSSSAPASVIINVVEPADTSGEPTGQQGGSQTGGQQPTGQTQPPAQQQPTNTAAPTNTPAPTNVPASATPSVPMARFNSGINVRSGPGTNFDPPIGTFAANTATEILALNPAGDWYKVRYLNGEGWVYGPLVTVEGGSISGLPREVGPPPPPPTPVPPPTAVPATPVPQSSVNLVFAGAVQMTPNPATCNQSFTITATVRNDGTTQSGVTTILVEDVHTASGTINASSGGALLLPQGGLAPGQSHTVSTTLTVSTYYNEPHYIRIRIDPNNQVPETNDADNEQQIPYTLQRGAC